MNAIPQSIRDAVPNDEQTVLHALIRNKTQVEAEEAIATYLRDCDTNKIAAHAQFLTAVQINRHPPHRNEGPPISSNQLAELLQKQNQINETLLTSLKGVNNREAAKEMSDLSENRYLSIKETYERQGINRAIRTWLCRMDSGRALYELFCRQKDKTSVVNPCNPTHVDVLLLAGMQFRYREHFATGADVVDELSRLIEEMAAEDETNERLAILNEKMIENRQYVDALADYLNVMTTKTIHSLVNNYAPSGKISNDCDALFSELLVRQIMDKNTPKDTSFSAVLEENGYCDVNLADITKRLNEWTSTSAKKGRKDNDDEKENPNGNSNNRNTKRRKKRTKESTEKCRYDLQCTNLHCRFWHTESPRERKQRLRGNRIPQTPGLYHNAPRFAHPYSNVPQFPIGCPQPPPQGPPQRK
eukprot:37098_1